MTGWVYLFALLATIAGVVYGAGPYLATLLGFDDASPRRSSARLLDAGRCHRHQHARHQGAGDRAVIGFAAELLGALVVGGWLLLTQRHHDLGVLFDSFGRARDQAATSTAFLAAGLIGVYQYYGFEACGDVAEEVPEPGARDPQGDAHDHLHRRRRRDLRLPVLILP